MQLIYGLILLSRKKITATWEKQKNRPCQAKGAAGPVQIRGTESVLVG